MGNLHVSKPNPPPCRERFSTSAQDKGEERKQAEKKKFVLKKYFLFVLISLH